METREFVDVTCKLNGKVNKFVFLKRADRYGYTRYSKLGEPETYVNGDITYSAGRVTDASDESSAKGLIGMLVERDAQITDISLKPRGPIFKVGISSINYIDLLHRSEYINFGDGNAIDYGFISSCPKSLKNIQLRVYQDERLYIARFTEDTKEILRENVDEIFKLSTDALTFASEIPFACFSIKSFITKSSENIIEIAYDMIIDLIIIIRQFYTKFPKIVEYATSLDALTEDKILEFYGLEQKIECDRKYIDEMIFIALKMFDAGLFKTCESNELLHFIMHSICTEIKPE